MKVNLYNQTLTGRLIDPITVQVADGDMLLLGVIIYRNETYTYSHLEGSRNSIAAFKKVKHVTLDEQEPSI